MHQRERSNGFDSVTLHCHWALHYSSLKLGWEPFQDQLLVSDKSELPTLALWPGERCWTKMCCPHSLSWACRDLSRKSDQRTAPANQLEFGQGLAVPLKLPFIFYLKKECGWFPFSFWEQTIWLTCSSWALGWGLQELRVGVGSLSPISSPGLQCKVVQVWRKPIKTPPLLIQTSTSKEGRKGSQNLQIKGNDSFLQHPQCCQQSCKPLQAFRWSLGHLLWAALGKTPPQQHPFSQHHLCSSAAGRGASKNQISLFALILLCSSDMHWHGANRRRFKAMGFLMTKVRDNLWPPHRENNNCWQGWKKCSHCEHKQAGRSSQSLPDVAEKWLGAKTTYEISITFLLIRKRVWVVIFFFPESFELENRHQQHSSFFFSFYFLFFSPVLPSLSHSRSLIGI